MGSYGIFIVMGSYSRGTVRCLLFLVAIVMNITAMLTFTYYWDDSKLSLGEVIGAILISMSSILILKAVLLTKTVE
jgi:hypothetical protein